MGQRPLWGDPLATQQSLSLAWWWARRVERMGIKRSEEPGTAWEIKWTGRGAHLLNFLVEFFLIRLYSFISLPACT